MKNRRNRKALALLLGLLAFGIATASAASLGGVTSDSLGADDGVVASCDTDGVTVDYAYSWDPTDQRYEVTGTTVGGISAACNGLDIAVTVRDAGSTVLGSGSGTVTGATYTVPMTGGPAAEAIEGVSIVIAG